MSPRDERRRALEDVRRITAIAESARTPEDVERLAAARRYLDDHPADAAALAMSTDRRNRRVGSTRTVPLDLD